jgi:hypothetical protein
LVYSVVGEDRHPGHIVSVHLWFSIRSSHLAQLSVQQRDRVQHGAHFQVLSLEWDDDKRQLDFNNVSNTEDMRAICFESSEL